MSKTTLEGRFTAVEFGEGTQNTDGRSPKQIPYVHFTIAEDSGRKIVVKLPLDISKNPFEERRLQKTLIGERVIFELDESVSGGYQKVYVNSGEYEGVILEHSDEY